MVPSLFAAQSAEDHRVICSMSSRFWIFMEFFLRSHGLPSSPARRCPVCRARRILFPAGSRNGTFSGRPHNRRRFWERSRGPGVQHKPGPAEKQQSVEQPSSHRHRSGSRQSFPAESASLGLSFPIISEPVGGKLPVYRVFKHIFGYHDLSKIQFIYAP